MEAALSRYGRGLGRRGWAMPAHAQTSVGGICHATGWAGERGDLAEEVNKRQQLSHPFSGPCPSLR